MKEVAEMGAQLPKYEETRDNHERTRLLKDIAKKEEQLEARKQEQKQANKRIKQIESSNTWKIGNTFQIISSIWKKLFGRPDLEKVDQLEKQLLDKSDQIEKLSAKLAVLQYLDDQLTKYSITQEIRSLKNDGQLLMNIESLVEQKNKIESNYRDALLFAARHYMNQDEATRNAIYEEIFKGLAVEEIPEFMIRAGLTETPVSLRQTSSFRASLSSRMRQYQLTGKLAEWHLDDKQTAYNFVEQFSIKVPELDETIYKINTIPKRESIVVKPIDAAGARGVYLIHEENYIFDVRNSKVLTSFSELQNAMIRDLESGAVTEDAWLLEQLIYENKKQIIPARDLKFYSFYGKVALVLEIVRDPEIRHAWWTRDGKRIGTGKYDATLFAGQGVAEEEIEQVEQLSAAVPAPFLRIDFLKSESGLVFGEFTPKPGNYDEFDMETDAWLGDYFVEAEARLVEDLLNGKTFPEYTRFVEEIEEEKAGWKINT